MSINTSEIDERLLLRISDGDQDAFRELYQRTSHAIYGFALSIVRNKYDAENVMHDAYLRIYSNAVSYKPMGKPMAWILTIVKNLCYSRLREGNICGDISEYGNLSGGDHSDRTIEQMMLKEALDILAFEDRQIVVLHALTGMKHREIAELLDMPVGTVLSKYNRALRKMRKEFAGKGEW